MTNLKEIVALCEDVAEADESVLMPSDEVFKLVASTELLEAAKDGLRSLGSATRKKREQLSAELSALAEEDRKERRKLVEKIRREIPSAYERHYGRKFGGRS
jgi:hypothetical protein